jgi:hypothetical protein
VNRWYGRARASPVNRGYETVPAVTTVIRRPVVLTAALAVLGTVLAGCGSGPSQVNAAVIIGDRVISVDEVQRRLDMALKAEPAARELAKNHRLDLVSRGIVSELIRHELLAEAARREGLTVSEQDVTELVTRGSLPEDPVLRSVQAGFDRGQLVRDQLLSVSLGQKYRDRLHVTVDGAVLASSDAREKADELARKLAAQPDRAVQLLESAATEEIQPVPDQTFGPISTFAIYGESQQQQVSLIPVLGVPENTVIAFPFGSGDQGAGARWLVALVRQRDVNGTPSEQEVPFASQVTPQWLHSVGQQLVSPLAAELGVRISPRYGVWDELAVGVAPNEAEKAGIVLPAANPRQ